VKAAILSFRARKAFLEALRWIANDNPASARALRDTVYRAAKTWGITHCQAVSVRTLLPFRSAS